MPRTDPDHDIDNCALTKRENILAWGLVGVMFVFLCATCYFAYLAMAG
jgi:hypothetical protein